MANEFEPNDWRSQTIAAGSAAAAVVTPNANSGATGYQGKNFVEKSLLTDFHAAYGKVQNPVADRANPAFRSKYATLDVVLESVRAILHEHNFSLMQSSRVESGIVIVTTKLLHVSGGTLVTDIAVGPPAANPQGFMGALTYGRRYGIFSMFGLATEDDDGNTASGKTDNVDRPVPVAVAGVSRQK